MKAIVKDFLFQSGAHRSMEENHRFFKYATNENHLDWLVFCQCLTQFEGKPGKRKSFFILTRFMGLRPDMFVEPELRDVFHQLFDVSSEDQDPVRAAVDRFPMHFSDKVAWFGFVKALKMTVTGETKPPAQLFQKQKETIQGVVGIRFDDFNEKIDYQKNSSMTGRRVSLLRQELTEANFNPDYMGIW